MKKLAAKLTALLLVCLLLPLTACSPVDFSEQINDVYAYEDCEVTVRMPRYYQASAMNRTRRWILEWSCGIQGWRVLRLGIAGFFLQHLCVSGMKANAPPIHLRKSCICKRSINQRLVEKWDALKDKKKLGPLKPGKYRAKMYWNFCYTNAAHDSEERITNHWGV